MAISPRSSVITALVGGSLLLVTGCGGEATGARTTIGTVQTTSYVVEDPVTTTTTTTLPTGVTVPGGEISPVEQSYVIVSGDSIYRIAELHGITPDVLINYNGWTDGLGHFLVVGETVLIPPNSKVPGAAPADTGGGDTGVDTGATNPPADTTPDTEAPAGIACEYTIVAGDTPSQVAGKRGVSLDELQAANPSMDFSTTFVVGDTINVPEPGTC